MGMLGDGTGTAYPATLDTHSIPETGAMYARIQVPNDIAAAVVAIEDELGQNPRGAFATVAARLNAMIKYTEGLNSARPAPTPGTRELYWSTDIEILEISTGTEWKPFMM